MRGIEHYISRAGFHCIRLHYSADPDKDPATPRGQAWYQQQIEGIVGGASSAMFRQEYEIDWEATGGELVFPQFAAYRNKIVVAPFDIPESWSLFGSFDYGHRNPSAFYVHAIDHDGSVFTVWEYYKSGEGYRDTARAIRSCPLFPRLSALPVADPSLWGNTQQGESEVKSVAQLFFELPESERIVFAKGKAGGDVTFAEKINGEFWKDLDKEAPKWKIFPTCPKLIWELEKIRYSEWSAIQQETHNLREQVVDRDNHAFDSCKYFFTRFFDKPTAPAVEKFADLKERDPAAWREWNAVQKLYRDEKRASLFGD